MPRGVGSRRKERQMGSRLNALGGESPQHDSPDVRSHRRTRGRGRGLTGQSWRACAALGAALLVAACSHSPAALPSASSTGTPLPTATVSAPASPVVFASTRYPYSITLPIGWAATP